LSSASSKIPPADVRKTVTGSTAHVWQFKRSLVAPGRLTPFLAVGMHVAAELCTQALSLHTHEVHHHIAAAASRLRAFGKGGDWRWGCGLNDA
jgi:hypothetical protein